MGKMNQMFLTAQAMEEVCPKIIADTAMNALNELCELLGVSRPSWYLQAVREPICRTTPFFRASKEVADEILFRLENIGDVNIYPPDFWADTLRLSKAFLDGIIA